MSVNREWIYRRYCEDGSFNLEFQAGLNSFIQFATSQRMFMDGDKIKCPCRKCDNIPYQEVKTVRNHIARHGFVHDYRIWRFQGETSLPVVEEERNLDTNESSSMYRTMVLDAAGHEFNRRMEEPPNPEAKKFFDMLDAVDKELWPGCKNHSQLSFVSRLLCLKAENNISQRCFDQITELISEIVPDNNLVPNNFYNTEIAARHGITCGENRLLPKKLHDFYNHRKFLPTNHVFRRNKKAFRKGRVVTTGPPEVKSGEEILNEIDELGLVKVIEMDSENINKGVARRFGTGWKKKSIFWDLPYWKNLLIRHNLDVMHIEKNVFDNVFNIVQVGGEATSVTRVPAHSTTLTICDGELCPDNKVPSTIFKIFKKIKNPTGYCWSSTPDSIKKSYWEEFKILPEFS